MTIKKIVKITLLIFLFVLLIGCGTQEMDESNTDVDEVVETTTVEEKESTDDSEVTGELRVAYSAQPPTLDLHLSTAAATTEIMGQVYESLITVDSEYNIVPLLAESYEQSDDGLVITFKLREGVLFHNGKEMKAEDVVASMNRWKDLPGGRGQFDNSVFEAIDDYTVEFKLDRPLSTALTALSQGGTTFAGIMPKEVVEDASAEGVNEHIGTGPFKFVEWAQDQHVHLTKFTDYKLLDDPADGLTGKKEALVKDIYFEFVQDPSTRVAGLQSGEYDIAQRSEERRVGDE